MVRWRLEMEGEAGVGAASDIDVEVAGREESQSE